MFPCLAAMRLRHLATTQSVLFVATPDVNQSIRDHRIKLGQLHGGAIDSHDVISWLIAQTCNSIEQLLPLYCSQGIDFCNRMQGALVNDGFLNDDRRLKSYLSVLQQRESHTLEELYDISSTPRKNASKDSVANPAIQSYLKALEILQKEFQKSGHVSTSLALQEVEHERELEFEVENVRELQLSSLPQPFKTGKTHPDIQKFAETGELTSPTEGYKTLIDILRTSTAVGNKHLVKPGTVCSNLYISSQFTRTAQLKGLDDNYLVSTLSSTSHGPLLRAEAYNLLSASSKLVVVLSKSSSWHHRHT